MTKVVNSVYRCFFNCLGTFLEENNEYIYNQPLYTTDYGIAKECQRECMQESLYNSHVLKFVDTNGNVFKRLWNCMY